MKQFKLFIVIAFLASAGCGGGEKDGDERVVETFTDWKIKYKHDAAVTDEAFAELPLGVEELEINPYCKYATDAGIAHLAKQTALRKLWISEAQITAEGLKVIGGLTNLEDLEIGSDLYTDADIAHLKGLKKLHTLSLFGKKITPAALEHVAQIPSLERFNSWATDKPNDKALEFASKLTKLKELNCTMGTYTDKGAVHIGKMVGLEKLMIGYSEITDVTIEAISKLPNVKELVIVAAHKVTDKGVSHLAKMPALVDLGLVYSNNVGGPGIAALKDAPNLRKLRVSSISPENAKFLAELKQLEELSFVEGDGVTEAHLADLGGLTNLKTLDATYTSVGSIDAVAGLTGLTSLNLTRTKMTDEGFKNVHKLTNLQSLYIGETLITSIEPIKELKSLEKVSLPQGVDGACIDILLGLPKLTRIHIDGKAKVTREDVERLMKAFPQASIWTQFD